MHPCCLAPKGFTVKSLLRQHKVLRLRVMSSGYCIEAVLSFAQELGAGYLFIAVGTAASCLEANVHF